MTQVKGSNLKYARDFALARGGEPAWQNLLSGLNDADRSALPSILASSWCELSLQHRVFRALDVSQRSAPSDDTITEFAEFVAKMDLTRVHRLFLRLHNPAYVLEKTAEYWRRFYDAGEWQITRVAADAARGELRGIADGDPIFCRFLHAYIRQMFRLSGATLGTVRHTQCAFLGAASCVYEGRWR
jgi:hypothetical protein